MDRDGAFVSQEASAVSMKHSFSPLISPQTFYAVAEGEIDRRVMVMKTRESDENEDNMVMAQRRDLELGSVVNLRLLWDECPTSLTLQTESEETRKFVMKNWNQFSSTKDSYI